VSTELDGRMRFCTRCPELVATRTQVVVGDRPAGARLLVIGEAPGAQEDVVGRPFVGRSGQLLDALLEEVGHPRHQVAVINTVKCRPPANRVPTSQETATCRDWTVALIDSVDPRVTVTLGLSATRWMVKTPTLSAVRGKALEVDGRTVLPTYHPAAALRGGPNGEAMVRLREDLALAVSLL
jgi:uracil-DNA glycosylase family 4